LLGRKGAKIEKQGVWTVLYSVGVFTSVRGKSADKSLLNITDC